MPPEVNTGGQRSPERLLEGGNPHYRKRTITGLLSALLLLAGAAGAATVTIDGAQTYQAIDGFGVCANSRSWTNNELQSVLDALIDQAGMTLLVPIFAGNSNWEATNDNTNANLMNWTYYNGVYSAPNFQKLWGMMAYLNQRGITDGLMPKFGGPVALWMGGSSLIPGYESEYAEMIASALIYARNTQHLQFKRVWPVNEPDITDWGGSASDGCSPIRHGDAQTGAATGQ